MKTHTHTQEKSESQTSVRHNGMTFYRLHYIITYLSEFSLGPSNPYPLHPMEATGNRIGNGQPEKEMGHGMKQCLNPIQGKRQNRQQPHFDNGSEG
eukprot:scaffold135687_cov61-Attheya_sp.AAC.2